MNKLKQLFNINNIHRCTDIILFICLAFLDAICLEPMTLLKYIKKSNDLGQCLLGACSLFMFALTIYLSYKFYTHLQNRYHNHSYTYKNILHAHLGKHNWANIFLTIIIIFVIQIIFSILGAIYYGHSQTANQSILNSLTSHGVAPFIIIMLLSIFLASPTEELLYRGCLLAFFKYPTKNIFSIPCIVSGFAFSVAHVSSNIISFLMYMLIGMLLAHCYLQSFHLKSSIYTHMIFNAITWGLLLIV